MAMYVVGTKIQAIDENGHWSDGKIVAVQDGKYQVKFSGWSSQYNQLVSENEIRLPQLPLHQQIQG